MFLFGDFPIELHFYYIKCDYIKYSFGDVGSIAVKYVQIWNSFNFLY